MTIDARLTELGIVIPETTTPVANYVTSRQSGNLLFISGHLGKRDGTLVTGRVGDDVDTDTGYDLARNAAIDILGTVRAALGTLDTVAVVKLTGFVQSASTFTGQPAVVNGVFGHERGRHSRSAIGVAQLPLGAAVEIEAIFEVVGPPA
jgi:enamine deaminase RidA (YjgF/YER057c/UK114 family)